MRCWLQTTLILAIGSTLFAAERASGDQAKDYNVFLARNPFSLRPPPKPPAPPEKIPEPEIPLNVKLTGISTLLNKKRVFLVNQPEGEPPIYLKMVEGEVDAGIEIISIDPDAGAVKVKIDGMAQTITFKDNGFKASGAIPAAPIVSPSGRKFPAPPIPAPPKSPNKFNFRRPTRTTKPLPTTSPRTSSFQPRQRSAPTVQSQAQIGNGSSISLNVNQTVRSIEPPRIPLQMTPEEQVLTILATQEKQGGGQLVTYQLANGKTFQAFKATPPFPISAADIGD
jgi:hypothetical protein